MNQLKYLFHIQSKYLKQIEPMLKESFDYDPLMLMDDISTCVINSDVTYREQVEEYPDNLFMIDFLDLFYKNESLEFTHKEYIDKRREVDKAKHYLEIAKKFGYYFPNVNDEAIAESEYTEMCLCLSYMAYIYYKYTYGYLTAKTVYDEKKKRQVSNYYNELCLFMGFDTDFYIYDCYYTEMLSLYKLILESKNPEKHRGLIKLAYNRQNLEINTFDWFANDMNKVLKNRFPDLTLDKINELLASPNRAGRKQQPINILIWGVYHLMKNHHPTFKHSKTKVITEICQFTLDYIDFLEIDNILTLDNILDYIKKTKNPPLWRLPWRKSYSDIEQYISKTNTK